MHLQLRVGFIAQLGGGGLLEIVEAGLAVIQGSQDTEWEGQDYPVEGGCVFSAGCGEGQGITPVRVGGDGRHTPVEVDGTGGPTVGDRRGALLVPPGDWVARTRIYHDATISPRRCDTQEKRCVT